MPHPRLALPADAAEISRLRSENILSEPLDPLWLDRCTDQLAVRLASGGDARAYVVDATGGRFTVSSPLGRRRTGRRRLGRLWWSASWRAATAPSPSPAP